MHVLPPPHLQSALWALGSVITSNVSIATYYFHTAWLDTEASAGPGVSALGSLPFQHVQACHSTKRTLRYCA